MNILLKLPRISRVPLIVLLSIALYVLSMPGPDFSGCAWFFAVPLAVWAMLRPSWKTWLLATWIFCYGSGLINLIWLRHLYPPLGWVAVLLLPVIYTAFPWFWFIALRGVFPQCTGERPLAMRLVNLLGLTGLWLVLEWMLTWIFTGFPWMPLGATQWDFPAVLSLCRFAGTPAISAMVIFFNLALARYIWRQFVEVRGQLGIPSPLAFLRSICPEFYLALLPVFCAIVLFVYNCVRYDNLAEKQFSFVAVQTDFEPNAKWNEQRVAENLNVLDVLTRAAPWLSEKQSCVTFPQAEALLRENAGKKQENPRNLPDFVLWPEAAMPIFYVEKNNPSGFDLFLERLSREVKTPLVLGGITSAVAKSGAQAYHNSVHLVDPRFGLVETFAAKRHLVPFGEYVPLADILPLRKVVPISMDCVPGESVGLLKVRSRQNRVIPLGILVCYEDVFPELGRDCVAAGAKALAVVTNDAWYGREAGAYQHMAHSVMQAVSLGVPVIRCGNAGWSGVISPIGQIQSMRNAEDSIYFRGAERFDVYAENDYTPTFYVRYGDWLVMGGAALFALAACLQVYLRKK